MTLNFYFNTKTLQVQGKASSEVKNKLHDIFSSKNKPIQNNGREGNEETQSFLHCTEERMAMLSNESAYGASFNKFSLLQEMSGIDADQSLKVLESIDWDVSEDTESETEPNENLRRAEISKSDLHVVLPDNKEISSLKIEELKAELDKRGLKKSGNKGTLVQRLRNVIVSEKLGSQIIETDTTYSQIESPANGQAFIQDTPRMDDIYSFIEIKVKEVCRLEVEKLKLEASTSYSNETIASLREENNLLNIRLQELESHYESVREEARTLSDENKSLMTVIRLLNKESQVATKEGKNIARDADNGSSVNLHNQQGQGQGQKKSNSNSVTQPRRATETGKKSEHLNTPGNKQGQRLPEELRKPHHPRASLIMIVSQ